jgi:endonuclease/exonuclease/phosphatase family metal-dependent hydrolase
VILGGDWNLTVGLRRSGEERNNRPGESDLLARLENEFGLRSAWDVANPDLPLPQTLRWMRNPTTPYHCDGIFLPQWRHVEKATVLTGETWADLSDHNPVAVDWSPPL